MSRPGGSRLRQRYFVIASVAYAILGAVILVRGLAAHIVPAAILGAVFVALGLVRLRDYIRAREA